MSSTDEGRGQEGRQDDRKVDEDTLDLIYEHTKEAPNLQLKDSEQLDTKINAVFAAATIALGLASRLPKTDGTRLSYVIGPLSGQLNLVDAFFYLAVAAWDAVALVTLVHLRTKEHRRALRADVLWSRYRHDNPTQLKKRLVKDIRKSYKHNKGVLDRKAKTFNRATTAAAMEGVFLVLALVLARAGG